MKKFKLYQLLVFFSLLLPFQASAFCLDWNCINFGAEARVAYFKPTSKKVRKIYSNGMPFYELEVSAGLDNWRLWAGVGGFSKKGRSIGGHNPTRLEVLPISFGLKYVFCLCPCVQFYFGGGAVYSHMKTKDHSPFVHKNTQKWTWGGVAQAGTYYFFNNTFYGSFFVDYLYQKFKFSHSRKHPFVVRHDADLSGFKVGVGIGAQF